MKIFWTALILGITILFIHYFFFAPRIHPTKEECAQVLSEKDTTEAAIKMALLVSQYQENNKLSWYEVLTCK